jgi:peptidoglycan/LPS O-acetylase OafA/YrhL
MHHRNNFDGMRLVGALMVLLSHQFALSGRAEPHVVGKVSFGALGVLIFFSISGYLVALSWNNDPDVRRFALRRLLRIWPGLAAVVLITAAVAFAATGHVAKPAYLANLLLVYIDGAFFPGNSFHLMNGSLWTVQLEVLCYVALGGLGFVSGSRLPKLLPVLACVAAPAYFLVMGPALDSGSVRPGFPLLPYFSAFFFAGAAQTRVRLSGPMVMALCVAGVIALVSGRNSLGLLLTVPALVVFVGRKSWPGLNQAGYFGDLSYGVYLWAWPVQQLGVVWLTKNASYFTLLSFSLLGVFLLAWLSWHFIEKRALMLKPSRPRTATAIESAQPQHSDAPQGSAVHVHLP